MVQIHSFSAAGETTGQTLAALAGRLAGANLSADLLFVFYGSDHRDAEIHVFLQERFPGVPVIGGTSSGGLLSHQGLLGPGAIGLLAVEDPEGEYGVATAPLGPDPAATARALLDRALAEAGCSGELPALVWIYQSPGQEEAVIEGLRAGIGDGCPIVGGSAADEAVEGGWRLMSGEGPIGEGLSVAVLFPSGGLSFAFQCGYEPAGASGVVTRVDAPAGAASRSRRILEIDGAPAAHVYDGWIGGRLAEERRLGGNVLAKTTLHPLGREVGSINGVPQYLLVHPDAVGADGTLKVFAAVSVGDRLLQMTGSQGLLVDRAGRVASEAASRLPGGAGSLAGGVMIYCAGCRMAVGENMDAVARQVRESLAGKPFLGSFTYGEQGQVVGRNGHGNLMISFVAFGR